MTTENQAITIGKITTKPEHDPYVNINGITSRTCLKLDPRDRTIWVTQEYNDNATPSDEWHGLVLTWMMPGHPSEAGMREWIESNMASFERICAGYESVWDGSNHVGRLTDDARGVQEAIEFKLDNDAGPANYYETWTVESWLESSLNEITANMTDEQLADLAEQWEPNSTTTVLGDILHYITQHRDNLRADAE